MGDGATQYPTVAVRTGFCIGLRRRIPDRQVLTGILFVLQTGIPWEYLPQEMGCGSGMTCWRRLHEWQQAGVWERLHEVLLKLHRAELIDWSRAAIDSSHVRAVGGAKTGPSPVDRGRRGSKHHLITCGQGNPLAVALTAGNVNDVTPGRPRLPRTGGMPSTNGSVSKRLLGDRAYHSSKHRRALRARGIQVRIAKPKSRHGSGLGRERWVVERTLSWLHQYRRLRIRYERRDDIHEAFLEIACSLICFKALTRANALC